MTDSEPQPPQPGDAFMTDPGQLLWAISHNVMGVTIESLGSNNGPVKAVLVTVNCHIHDEEGTHDLALPLSFELAHALALAEVIKAAAEQMALV